MKNLIAFLFWSLGATCLFGTDTLTTLPTPTLPVSYVYAQSGLNLRSAPETNGQVIKVIPFGDKVEILELTDKQQQIEWIDGLWVKVRHGEQEGYLFEGFLSSLPLPSVIDGTTTRDDLDLTYPLINWADLNFDQVQSADTLEADKSYTLTRYLEKGNWYSQTDSEYRYRLNVLLKDTKLTEVHNLLKSMLQTKPERITYMNKSTYISNVEGQIEKIRVELKQPVQLTSVGGDVLITVTSYHEACDVY